MYAVQSATAIAVILPMIEAYGTAVSYVLCASLIWISYRYVVVPKKKKRRNGFVANDDLNSGLYYLIKYGDQMRAWVDIGFSTSQS